MEGEPDPDGSVADHLAIKAWNLLATGSGGFDWSGLPLAAAWLGIDDIEGLIDRLSIIKHHKPQPENPNEPGSDPTEH